MAEFKNKEDLPIIVAWVGTTDVTRMHKWYLYNELGKEKSIELITQAKLSNKDFSRDENVPELESIWNNGPIRTITDAMKASKIYLLCSKKYIVEKQHLIEWVGRGSKAEVIVIDTKIDDPTSFDLIRTALDDFYYNYFDESSMYIFNVTPGTPAMQLMTMSMVTAKFLNAKIYVTKDPRFIKDNIHYEDIKLPNTFEYFMNNYVSLKSTTASIDIKKEVIKNFARFRTVTILLTGESGVGKTEFAKEIHEKSEAPFNDEDKFIYVNCAEIATDPTNFAVELFGAKKGAYTGCVNDRRGKFELAQNGTLFLDEIGEVPKSMQSILLNAIQNKEIRHFGEEKQIKLKNVRIISATNRNLIEEVRKGNFREDLYYRIAMCPVALPPLRKIAKEDASTFEELVQSTFKSIKNEDEKGFSFIDRIDATAMEYIKNQSWPGNLRQLHHVLLLSFIKAISLKSKVITKQILQEEVSKMELPCDTPKEDDKDPDFIPKDLKGWLLDKEKAYIKMALEKSNNNVAAAKDLVGYNYQNLNNFVKKYNLK